MSGAAMRTGVRVKGVVPRTASSTCAARAGSTTGWVRTAPGAGAGETGARWTLRRTGLGRRAGRRKPSRVRPLSIATPPPQKDRLYQTVQPRVQRASRTFVTPTGNRDVPYHMAESGVYSA